MAKKKTKPALVPLISGWSTSLGFLVAGEPFTRDVAGQELPVALMKRIAADSQCIELVEIEVQVEPESEPAGDEA